MDPCKKLHVVILSSPGLGHLIPVIVIGNRLATHHDAKVSVIVIGTPSSPQEFDHLKQQTKGTHLEILEVPPVDVSHLIDSNTKLVKQLFIMVRAALPGVRSAIAGMKHRPEVFIVDLFCTSAFSIAAELGIPKYVYVPCSAWFTALTIYCSVLDKQIVGQYVDQIEPLKIPGCMPVRPEDVADPMLDRNDAQYQEYVNLGVEFTLSDGILINTWEVMEPISLRAFREDEALSEVVKVPIYPIGPLRRQPEMNHLDSELKDWLDKQPNESVLYVSFGSGGSLSREQLNELAWGLELSRQRFIWVVRPHARGGSEESYLKSSEETDSFQDYFHEGFLNRIKDIGLIIPLWAQQVEILSHQCIGGFLSHCGWSSILESLTNCVPMIAWPLYAEQRQNATLLTEELSVAIRTQVLQTKKVVERVEIEKLIKRIMINDEGKKTREHVKQLKISGDEALNSGGTSFNSMCKLVKDVELKLIERAHM